MNLFNGDSLPLQLKWRLQFLLHILIFCSSSANADSPSLKKQLMNLPLSDIQIASVTIDTDSVADALEMLGHMVKEATQGKIAIQYVFMNVENERWNRNIQISTSGASAGRIIKEVLTQANMAIRLDNYAIVVGPAEYLKDQKSSDAKNIVTSRRSRINFRTTLHHNTIIHPRVESSSMNDTWDKKSIKGRRPFK